MWRGIIGKELVKCSDLRVLDSKLKRRLIAFIVETG
jgi:hypothetical protein